MHYHTSEQEKIELGFGGHTCNNGMHFCALYETEEERDDIIFGFLHQGIENNDLGLFCPVEQTKAEFIDKFCTRYPAQCSCMNNSEKIVFNTVDELYFPDGEFSPLKMDQNLEAFWIESQKEGERSIRASAEMIWVNEKGLDNKKLFAYESRLNYFIPGKPWVSICLYNLKKFDGAFIMQVLQTHPFTIGKGGIITQNPYYIDPTEWLSKNAPEYLNAIENK